MVKKFDVVIGNPPYQEEPIGGAGHAMPIYHRFIEAAFDVGAKAVLITPARFLFNAGYTPKEWDRKMLNDPHLCVASYAPNSNELFPGTDIRGGIVVTYRDDSRAVGPIGTFAKHDELERIVRKVTNQGGASLTDLGITNDRVYRYTQALHDANPQAFRQMSSGNEYKIDSKAFTRLPTIFQKDPPLEEEAFVRVLGLGETKMREFRWIRSEFIAGPENLHGFKVAIPAANGSGHLGEALSTPLVLCPRVATTATFVTMGCFDTQAEAGACLAYVKTKFARVLLGVLKITQHNPARVWRYVPIQDFTGESDIDWTKSISEIDQQLYAKYKLDADEIAFIETQAKPMS